MKNFLITSILLCFYINTQAVATVCNADGSFCMEVSQLKLNGQDWENACCHHLPYVGTCTDDCGLSAPPPDPLNTPNNVPSHFSLPDGNKVWIRENEEISSNTYSESSPEYEHLNSMESYDFLNNDPNLEYILVKIDDNTEAIIEKVESSNRVKFGINMVEDQKTDNDVKVNLFPNPTTANAKVYIQSNKLLTEVGLIDQVGKLIVLNFQNSNNNTKEFQLPSTLSSGIYFLKLQFIDSSQQVKKIVINN